jgi:hypothetical protein
MTDFSYGSQLTGLFQLTTGTELLSLSGTGTNWILLRLVFSIWHLADPIETMASLLLAAMQ